MVIHKVFRSQMNNHPPPLTDDKQAGELEQLQGTQPIDKRKMTDEEMKAAFDFRVVGNHGRCSGSEGGGGGGCQNTLRAGPRRP